MYIVVGLGNPGPKYEDNRHNIGFMVIDYLSRKYNFKVNKIKHKALIGECLIGMEKLILAKPQTYMNLSGESVIRIVEYYKIPMEKLILVYDDVDLKTGLIRIRYKGSSGTHNGMKSVIYLLNRDDFPRVRIGIGKPPSYMDLADYVTSDFSKDEIPIMENAVIKAADSIEEIVRNGIDSAMNKFNISNLDES